MIAIEPIQSLDDPRIEPYRDLKDRELAQHSATDAAGGRFIAEGELVVRRLLESDYRCESILLAQKRLEKMTPLLPADVPVYVVPDPLIQHVVGFKFHSGVMACGRRKPPLTFERLAGLLSQRDRATIVVCPEIANTENLGALIRLCAGFGVDAMILGENCCDPFYRQSIRVSMGAVFRLNVFESKDLLHDLIQLKQRCIFELAATVLDESAQPLARAARGARLAILFGNEAQGLSQQVLSICDRQITIPMKLGTDSLNVAFAAAIFLYHFTLLEK